MKPTSGRLTSLGGNSANRGQEAIRPTAGKKFSKNSQKNHKKFLKKLPINSQIFLKNSQTFLKKKTPNLKFQNITNFYIFPTIFPIFHIFQ